MKKEKTQVIKNKKAEKSDSIEFPDGVLKIRKGTNPNSSSIGTLVYSFPFAVIGVSSIVAILATLLSKKRSSRQLDQKQADNKENTDAAP